MYMLNLLCWSSASNFGFNFIFCHVLELSTIMFQKIIPFPEVTSVRRAKTAGLFPNAIEILAGNKKVCWIWRVTFMLVVFQWIYALNITFVFLLCCNVLIHLFILQYFFASFLSRDEAFRIINEGWSRHGNGAIAIMEQKVFTIEPSLDTNCLLVFVLLVVCKVINFYIGNVVDFRNGWHPSTYSNLLNGYWIK